MRYTATRFARLFISASLVVAFVPVSHAGALTGSPARALTASRQHVVSVVSQTTYTDARGARWVDAVVSNGSEIALTNVRVPITFEVDGRSADDTILMGNVQPYVVAPGGAAVLHLELDRDIPDSWEPVVGAGVGMPSDTPAHALEIVSVEEVDTDAVAAAARSASVAPDDPFADEPAVDDESGEDAGDDEVFDEASAAIRTYRVEVKNGSQVPLNHVRVSGSEQFDDGSAPAMLLDTVVSDSHDIALEPGDSATFDVYGMAFDDVGGDISLGFAASGLEVPVVTLKVLSAKPSFGSRVVLKASVSRADGSKVSGTRELGIAWSVDGDEWQTAEYDTQSGSVTKAIVIDGPLRCKAVFGMDGEFGAAESAELLVKPASEVTEPNVVRSARKARPFSVSGLVKPDYAAGTRKVKLEFYRLEKSGWKLRHTAITTTASFPGSYAKYSAKVKLPSSGKWKVRAYNPGDERALGSVSGFKYLSVR